MKVSFFVPSSKSQSKPKPVNTFEDTSTARNDADGSKHFITEFDPSKPAPSLAPKILIPPLQNECKLFKKMKNLHLPTADPECEPLTFEVHAANGQPDSNLSYGLSLRTDKITEQNNGTAPPPPPRRVPVEGTMLQKQKDDMERLPEDQGFDKLKDVTVEGFGAALMAGYGWKEGMGMGKNAKEDVKIWEVKQRIGKEGLGFVGDAPAALVRSSNDKDKKKNEKKKGEERCLRKLKESKIQHEEDRGPKRKRDRDEVDQRKVSWLTSHIRVRVISKDLKGGRLFLKKGEILDVVGPTTCDVCMDESTEIVQGVFQDFLETAIPKRGGPVLVLAGKYKGVFGSLVERDLYREMAIVSDWVMIVL